MKEEREEPYGCEYGARLMSDPGKSYPVLFVGCIIVGLYCFYLFGHLLNLMQVDLPPDQRDNAVRQRGVNQCIAVNIVTLLLIICFIRSILTDPGGIPEHDPTWLYEEDKDAKHGSRVPDIIRNTLKRNETKRTGEWRHCKWCAKYKPDRCHHCRVCQRCVLKMDHHCPWIYQCVGYRNYKFFFLLIFYSAVDCHILFWTMIESLQMYVDDVDAPFGSMFMVFFGSTLAFVLGTLLTGFWIFHSMLVFKAMSTIEWCEKSTVDSGLLSESASKAKEDPTYWRYDNGCLQNFQSVLGQNILMWPFPIAPELGDGLHFVSNERSDIMGAAGPEYGTSQIAHYHRAHRHHRHHRHGQPPDGDRRHSHDDRDRRERRSNRKDDRKPVASQGQREEERPSWDDRDGHL